MRVISWNTAKRLRKIDEQVNLLLKHDADIVTLQEIIPSTELKFKRQLSQKYPYQVSSFELAPDLSVLKNKRMFGQLIASKYPIQPQSPKLINVPWQERVLSSMISIDGINIIFHTTHIPPGSSNGWVKIEMISGIVKHLISSNSSLIQVLCGDFNTPKNGE